MKSISSVLAIFILFACSSKKNEKSFVQKDTSFYPVSSFIQTELLNVDSMPVALFYIRTADGKSDTSIVDKKVLHQQAADIISPDISKEPLKEKYEETVFMDETINSVTLSYSTEDPDAEVRKIEVFVSPDTEKVKYVYVEKTFSRNDSSFTKKMIWTTGKYLQVNSSITPKTGSQISVQEKFTWDLMN